MKVADHPRFVAFVVWRVGKSQPSWFPRRFLANTHCSERAWFGHIEGLLTLQLQLCDLDVPNAMKSVLEFGSFSEMILLSASRTTCDTLAWLASISRSSHHAEIRHALPGWQGLPRTGIGPYLRRRPSLRG